MTKKLILILGIVVIVGGVAFFVISQSSGPAGESGTGGFSFRDFFPFGDSSDVVVDENNTSGGGDTTGSEQPISGTAKIQDLRKISGGPVAGAVLFGSGATSTARFVEKATGNVYEVKTDSPSVRRLTNTTIPKIIRAFWLPDGTGFLAQTTNEEDLIETSFIRLKAVSASSTEPLVPYESVISKLPTGIKELSVSPDSKKIIYYTTRGVSDWFVANPDGTGSKLVYQSNLTEWIPAWFNQNSVLISTKASSATSGFGFVLNTTNSQTRKVFGDLTGASAKMSPDGKYVLVSVGGDSSILTFVNTQNGSQSQIGTRTIAEKCVWVNSGGSSILCGIPKSLPGGDYPDSWYMGQIETNDVLGIVDSVNSTYFVVSDPKTDVGEEIDVSEIMVSKNGGWSAFINKKDSSLWLLKIRD